MTRPERLSVLRASFQASQARILDLSRLRGADHATIAIMIAREVQNKRLLAEQILNLQKDV